MSSKNIQGKVGGIALEWLSAPKGAQGSSSVRVGHETLPVAWRRDAEGIWIELPTGVFGFDIVAEASDEGGVTWRLKRRGGDEEFAGVRFARAGSEQGGAGAAGAKKKGTRVRAQMPGKIVRILVQAGAQVEKGQPLLVMEAMKMENEIRAAGAGKVSAVKVTEGQAVETGADLMLIE